jgi:hypothetical protein
MRRRRRRRSMITSELQPIHDRNIIVAVRLGDDRHVIRIGVAIVAAIVVVAATFLGQIDYRAEISD